jgi:hypothetical protein
MSGIWEGNEVRSYQNVAEFHSTYPVLFISCQILDKRMSLLTKDEVNVFILRFFSMFEWNFWSFLCMCSMCYRQQISINCMAEHTYICPPFNKIATEVNILLSSVRQTMLSFCLNSIMMLWQLWWHLEILTAIPTVDSSSKQKSNHLSTIKMQSRNVCLSLCQSVEVGGRQHHTCHADHHLTCMESNLQCYTFPCVV